ncbi:MAG: LuxR C-terminal-related transcriptional regulator [Chloroflexota bacterium]
MTHDTALARPRGLPAPMTSFVGREADLDTIDGLVSSARLLTLTGVGGVGKTRLAHEVATRLGPAFADGVRLVELASLADGALVPSAVAGVLDIREQPGQSLTEQMITALQPRELLLVIDNCEHLSDACAALVASLLRACPRLKVLATSRSPLRLYGEHEYPVHPLALPDLDALPAPEVAMHTPAIALFVHRARAARPEFRLDAGSVRDVAQLCHRLDGLPLAIELAAARVKVLAPAEILGRMDSRFRLLVGDARDIAERHLTLNDAIGWSFDLLGPGERALYRRLGIFAGGWTLEAAEEVCTAAVGGVSLDRAEVLDLLVSLVDQSLVVAEQRDGVTRYRFLETVRELSLEQLRDAGEEMPIRHHHARYFANLAEAGGREHWGAHQHIWFRRLEVELPNLRAALAYGIEVAGADDTADAEGDDELALRLCWGLFRLWDTRGYVSEGRQWLADALAAAPRVTRARIDALNAATSLAGLQLDLPAADHYDREAMAQAETLNYGFGRCLSVLFSAGIAMTRGDMAGAEAALDAADTTLWDELDPVHRSICRGIFAYYRGAFCQIQQRFPAAQEHLEQALALAREAQDQWGQAHSLIQLATLAYFQGNRTGSAALNREALVLQRQLGDRSGIRLSLHGVARSVGAVGDHGRAVRLYGAAAAFGEAFGGTHQLAAWREVDEQTLARAREALGEDDYAAAWSDGQRTTFEEAIALALVPDDNHRTEQPTPGNPEIDDLSPLSRREREIALMIARGHTNRQIGQALSIAERTAETHARAIRQKLGVKSRTQIASWVAQQGWLDE